MRCKRCGERLRVQGSRPHGDGFLRVRKCPNCMGHYLSIELILTKKEIERVTGVTARESRLKNEHFTRRRK